MDHDFRDGVDADFGRTLASVDERDVDLLLLEEFQVSDEFVAWFCQELGLSGVAPDSAWHSVSDLDGESDLLLRVLSNGRRLGVYIENKIGAPEQDRQAERYHIRAKRALEQKKLEEFLTVICAPRQYLDALNTDSPYQHRVPYERIADWFGEQLGRRASWRRYVMLEAIEQGRRRYVMVVNAENTAFHRAYWDYLRNKHPRILMAEPKKRGKKSTWIILKGHDFPKGVLLHHKLDQRVMELGYLNRTVNDILAAKGDWPEDIRPAQKGGTASLQIAVPPIEMNLGFDAQLAAIETAIEAAYRLTPYASLLQGLP